MSAHTQHWHHHKGMSRGTDTPTTGAAGELTSAAGELDLDPGVLNAGPLPGVCLSPHTPAPGASSQVRGLKAPLGRLEAGHRRC